MLLLRDSNIYSCRLCALYFPFFSFFSNKTIEEENAKKRSKPRCIWLGGQKAVTLLEAAEEVVEEAKTIIQEELGGVGIEWKLISKASANRISFSKDKLPLKSIKKRSPSTGKTRKRSNKITNNFIEDGIKPFILGPPNSFNKSQSQCFSTSTVDVPMDVNMFDKQLKQPTGLKKSEVKNLLLHSTNDFKQLIRSPVQSASNSNIVKHNVIYLDNQTNVKLTKTDFLSNDCNENHVIDKEMFKSHEVERDNIRYLTTNKAFLLASGNQQEIKKNIQGNAYKSCHNIPSVHQTSHSFPEEIPSKTYGNSQKSRKRRNTENYINNGDKKISPNVSNNSQHNVTSESEFIPPTPPDGKSTEMSPCFKKFQVSNDQDTHLKEPCHVTLNGICTSSRKKNRKLLSTDEVRCTKSDSIFFKTSDCAIKKSPKIENSNLSTKDNFQELSNNVTFDGLEGGVLAQTQQSFTIIDVCSNAEIFKTFTQEWKSKERFSLTVACEIIQEKANFTSTIGSNFIDKG
ncbi:hypothetical protein SNE40_018252 [Patella caerulea]|uniref:Uncharacterized protein n=1 Tax=Patella caerulea TaxID=87958 RepID=A0AAN8J7C8_PATCE